MTNQQMYDELASMATLAEAGGLAKERSVLLLWFLRNVIGVDDLDAYEYVCDGDNDNGVDALYLEPGAGVSDTETLVIYQSKYTEAPTMVGPGSLERLIAIASNFTDPDSLAAMLTGRVEERLRTLVDRYDLIRKLRSGAYRDGKLRVRIALVTTGVLNADAKRLVESTNRTGFLNYFTVYDLNRLGPLARAVAIPTVQAANISVPCTDEERIIIGEAPNRVAIASVRALDIVNWAGIDDRTLFELNVRREVRRNKVRDQLDGAIRRPHDHKDFLAYHNGMTVTCESFEVSDDELIAKKPSVVNGAQSAIALARGGVDGALTADLRIFVKFIEVAGRPQLAKEISWRSNTQTAVNSRNLVAIGGPQARIKDDFDSNYPQYEYETRPDATLDASAGVIVIKNDDAAQMLCAIYNEMPWLAVKRLALFESENHALIFNEDIGAKHIILCQVIRDAIESEKERVPALYRRSWQLTRMVMMYMVGQIMRSDDNLVRILTDPATVIANGAELVTLLQRPVRVAAGTLKQRADQHVRDTVADEFNISFKRQDVLLQLRERARDNYSLANVLD